MENSAGFKETFTKYALKIDSRALPAGRTFEFTVVVALAESPSVKTTIKTSIVVQWSPLRPAIFGGKRCDYCACILRFMVIRPTKVTSQQDIACMLILIS